MKKLIMLITILAAAASFAAVEWDWTVDSNQMVPVAAQNAATETDGAGAGWFVEVIGGNTTGGNTDRTIGWYGGYFVGGFKFKADEGASIALQLWDSATPNTGWSITSNPTILETGFEAPPTSQVAFDFTGSTWQAVPEPATVGLFGLGALSAWAIRRNKQKSIEEEEEI